MRCCAVQPAISAVISLISRGAVVIVSRAWAMRIETCRLEIWGFGRLVARRFRRALGGIILARMVRKTPMQFTALAAAFLVFVGLPAGVRAQVTDLLLILAADVSRSIDET